MNSKQKSLLVLIILVAIFFRFYQIVRMPGGLFPDEAANGLDINLMQQGNFQPFYQRGNGREALFFYMEWASTAIFGKGQWQFHIVSSLIGVLSVLMVYFVTFRLFLMGQGEESDDKKRNRAVHIGLLAAFLMAVSSWHVVLSRTALRANLTPLFGALTLYFLLRAYQAQSQKAKYWFSILTGASFGLGFYTYIAYRIMLPILFFILVWPLFAAVKNRQLKDVVRKYWKYFSVFCASFLVFVFWIADYFYHNFSYFTGRSGQVSIFNQSLYTVNGLQLTSKPTLLVVASVFWAVLKTAVTGFFIHGDLNWRQNISGYPFLSPLISPFFGIGLAVVTFFGIWYFFAPAKKSGYWKYFLLTGWFWGMLLPELATAEGIPHGLRSAGAIAPTFIICALAIYEFAQFALRVHRRLWQHIAPGRNDPKWIENQNFIPPKMRLVNLAFKLLAVCFFVALTMQTYFLYFIYAANSPEYFYAFRADLTPVSQYLVSRCNESLAQGQGSTKNSTYLVLDTYSEQTPDYLTSDPKGDFSQPCNVPYQVVDPASSWQLPPLQNGQQVVFTESTLFDARKFTQNHPEARLLQYDRNQFNQIVMAVYAQKNSQ
jgi:4-amino-4-deoxy-L-arabinose transferase-like glycosyltransferase